MQLELFTLDWLNNEIQNFPYSSMDSGDKPSILFKTDLLKLTCKQTGAGMMQLGYVLPHVIFWRLPPNDRHYKNFIKFLQIVLLCTSPYANENTVGEIDQRVATFYTEFPRLYDSAGIHPKAHQCAHLSHFIKKFGPGRGFWCFRMEAKHAFFKNLKLKNYINLPKSLCQKHSMYMASLMIGSGREKYSLNYVYAGHVTSVKGNSVDLSIKHETRNLWHKIGNRIAFEVKSVKINGLTYQEGLCLLVSWDGNDEWPCFAMIEGIYCHSDDTFWFLIDLTETVQFKWQLNSYEIVPTRNYDLIELGKLVNTFPLPVYCHGGRFFVTNRYCHFQNAI